MSETNRIIRKFERLMFNGVPEKPEPSFQRTLHADVDDRFTGKSLKKKSFVDKSEMRKIANITYKIDTEETIVERISDTL